MEELETALVKELESRGYSLLVETSEGVERIALDFKNRIDEGGCGVIYGKQNTLAVKAVPLFSVSIPSSGRFCPAYVHYRGNSDFTVFIEDSDSFDIRNVSEAGMARLDSSMRERQIGRKLNGNPGIVETLDQRFYLSPSGKGDQILWSILFTERLFGKTLQKIIAESATEKSEFSLQRAYDITVDLGNLLKLVWDQGILHRDLKPSNIHVGDSDLLTLLDWGLAAQIAQDLSCDDQYPSLPNDTPDLKLLINQKWLDRTQFGTPRYVAPEMFYGTSEVRRDPAVDIYSYALVVYKMVLGQLPFPKFADEKHHLWYQRKLYEDSDFRIALQSAVQSQMESYGHEALALPIAKALGTPEERDLDAIIEAADGVSEVKIKTARRPIFSGDDEVNCYENTRTQYHFTPDGPTETLVES